MTTDLSKLTTPFTFKHGATIKAPIAMSPMVPKAAETDGTIGADALAFYGARSNAAGLLITGAANVNEAGDGFDRGVAISDDKYLPGLTKLAATMKQDGNKAVVQLYHGGREAYEAQKHLGHTVAPSAIKFPFLPYTPEAMTETEIEQTIQDFAAAAHRAIVAGFDGVEIHGANHYLLQQFFSSYSNHRTDKWGGSLEKRMAFPLAVVKAVKDVVAKEAPDDFIVGYRISPDEIHGDTIGYTVDDALKLIDKVADFDLDYIHTSIFTGYSTVPEGHNKSYGELVKDTVAGRAATIIVSSVFTPADAIDALNYGDIVAIAREALMEPQFLAKLQAGKAADIVTAITPDRVADLKFTPELADWFLMDNSPMLPLPGQENLKPLLKK